MTMIKDDYNEIKKVLENMQLSISHESISSVDTLNSDNVKQIRPFTLEELEELRNHPDFQL